MLSGCTDVDPQQHGLTSDEERAAARLVQVRGEGRGAAWPGAYRLGEEQPPG